MLIPLQSHVIYGPMRSRRFGASLGVNLLPAERKLCNFDCVYCQYGDTGAPAGRPHFPRLDELESGLRAYAERNGASLDWIMIAGNGEPTLHPRFSEAVGLLKDLRDRLFPGVPVGILSNSSTCHLETVREALARLDGRFMKLDAGEPGLLGRVNQPVPSFRMDRMVEALARLKDTVLQSLFIEGAVCNTDARSVGDWIAAVAAVRPREVQLYTADRPMRQGGLRAVPRRALLDISVRLLDKTGIPGVVYGT